MLGRKDRRISLLPAWVDDCGPRTSSEKVIVFKKECPENIFQVVCTALNNQGIDYEVYEYGKFKKQEYLQTLSETKFLIYLQTSETQWIALHEAWMRDVPTLVWNRGYCEYKWNIWKDPHISAPYLTSECGMFFTSEEDFPETFHLFFQKLSLYSPRQYSLDDFTHKQTIAKLLSLL